MEKEVEKLGLAQNSPQFPESEKGNENTKAHQIADEHLIHAPTRPLMEEYSFQQFFQNVEGGHKQGK